MVAAEAQVETVRSRRLAWDESNPRDLRIDFIRGAVMLILLIVHLDVYSAYTLFGWGRIGLVSGAEGFAILSGIVLGFVHRKRIAKDGWRVSSGHLVDRAMQLYRVNLTIIAAILLIDWIPIIDASHIMTFKDWGSGEVFPLFPHESVGWPARIAMALTLRVGPHQVQILGLYTVLLMVAPLATWLLHKGRVRELLGVSWVLYSIHILAPGRPTLSQFEYAFPVLAWQLIFFHGLAAGFYRTEILAFFRTRIGHVVLMVCVATAFLLAIFVQSDPNPGDPSWARADFIDPALWHRIVGAYGSKSHLGLLRLLNDFVLVVSAMALLTVLWRPIHYLLGWFLVPLGQASLYVFIVHVFFVCALFNIPYFRDLPPTYLAESFWLSTVAHTLIFLCIWGMVKAKLGFRWIPR